ncbi:MAG: M23 family metallopeptidase [Ilumatobacteraceae bacterium]
MTSPPPDDTVTGDAERDGDGVVADDVGGIADGEAPADPAEPMLTPIVGAVPVAPVPFEGSDARIHLVYELRLTNYFPGPVTIGGVEVLDAGTGEAVASVDDVAERLKPAGVSGLSAELAAGQAGTLFLHVILEPDAAIPAELTHEMDVSLGPDEALTERLAPTTVDARTLPVLGPPMIGEGYLAADGCCDATRHRNALLAVDGQTYLAQRFAIDYEQLDGDGRIYVGDPADPESYLIYGDEALAVADGTVVVALDGLDEAVPGAFPEITLAEADGNSVVLDIGDGFFVNYAHFQPGSLRVEVGDEVRKGDVLGLVGNSGRSIAPHLHLHVMDSASPLKSEGLPYVMEPFEITGQGASTEDFDRAEAEGIPLETVPGLEPTEHTDQMVLDQSIVTFRDTES